MSRSLHVVWQNKEFFGEFSKSLPMCNGFFVDNKEEVSLGNWEMLQINCFLIGCFSELTWISSSREPDPFLGQADPKWDFNSESAQV